MTPDEMRTMLDALILLRDTGAITIDEFIYRARTVYGIPPKE